MLTVQPCATVKVRGISMPDMTFPTDEDETSVMDDSTMKVLVDEDVVMEEELEEELIIEDFTIDGICGVY
jgi:mycofactocin precursor